MKKFFCTVCLFLLAVLTFIPVNATGIIATSTLTDASVSATSEEAVVRAAEKQFTDKEGSASLPQNKDVYKKASDADFNSSSPATETKEGEKSSGILEFLLSPFVSSAFANEAGTRNVVPLTLEEQRVILEKQQAREEAATEKYKSYLDPVDKHLAAGSNRKYSRQNSDKGVDNSFQAIDP